MVSRHLTPGLVSAAEIAKMPDMNTIIAIHIKARFREVDSPGTSAIEFLISRSVFRAPSTILNGIDDLRQELSYPE